LLLRFGFGPLAVYQLHDESSLTDSPLNLGVWDAFVSTAHAPLLAVPSTDQA
jgi:hypothetical protein